MQISPIPTLSDDINDIRTRTANIVAEKKLFLMKEKFIQKAKILLQLEMK